MNIRRIVSRIVVWWASRRVEKQLPEIAEIAREIEARRRSHRPVRRLMRAQRDLIHARLAAEQGRQLRISK
jgi:HAMP domain-containing protein